MAADLTCCLYHSYTIKELRYLVYSGVIPKKSRANSLFRPKNISLSAKIGAISPY